MTAKIAESVAVLRSVNVSVARIPVSALVCMDAGSV